MVNSMTYCKPFAARSTCPLITFVRAAAQKPYEIKKIKKYFCVRVILSSCQMMNLTTKLAPFAPRSTCKEGNYFITDGCMKTAPDRQIKNILGFV